MRSEESEDGKGLETSVRVRTVKPLTQLGCWCLTDDVTANCSSGMNPELYSEL